MTAQSGANHGPEREKRWVKPLVEEVVLEPTDDVLGACYQSSSVAPVPGACGGPTFTCAY